MVIKIEKKIMKRKIIEIIIDTKIYFQSQPLSIQWAKKLTIYSNKMKIDPSKYAIE